MMQELRKLARIKSHNLALVDIGNLKFLSK